MTEQETARPRGKILRIKRGTNPNSSSVGSDIPTFFAMAAGVGGISALLTHLFDIIHERIKTSKPAKQVDGPAVEEDDSVNGS